MKIRVVNKNFPWFNQEFKVMNMNYDMVVVKNEEDKLPLNMEDVEIIPENIYEEAVFDCKDMLKIKLDNGVALSMYTALAEGIKGKTNGEIISVDVFKDSFRVIKKGIWEKNLMLVVNGSIPFDINIIGRKYGNRFDITIKDVTLQEFIETCAYDINCLRKEIEQKEMLISVYKKSLKEVVENSIKLVPSINLLSSGECSMEG